MKILFTTLLTTLCFLSFGQGCTISKSNLVELSGDDGFGNCTYSVDILFIEGNGPDNGTLTFSSPSATILTGAGPHSCACSGTTYTLTFEAACGSSVTISAFHNNSGNGNDCTVTLSGIALGVEWLLFKLKQESKNTVVLNWSTAIEVNNASFEVEYSRDGTSFELLTSVKGAGTSNHRNDYSFRHFNDYSGITYYRIKQIDFDGNFSYSEIRHKSTSQTNVISIFPNPVKQTLFITDEEASKYHIIDLNGKKIISTAKKQIDTQILENGMYTLLIESNGIIKRRQFIKSN